MCGALGWQAVWSMEMAYASPLLLSLGLTKAVAAAILLAGPLAGLVVQPSIGYLSDSCTHSWGRRRPWLGVACIVATIGMLALGFARPIAAIFGSVSTTTIAPRPAQVIAAVGVFMVDFGVNAVMALDRALCVDMLPASHQALGANWAARLAGLGDVLGLNACHMDLTQVSPFRTIITLLGLQEGSPSVPGLSSLERQMACLCLLSSSALQATHIIAAYVAVEVPLRKPNQISVREPLPDLPPVSMVFYLFHRSWEYLCDMASKAVTSVWDLIMDLVRTVRALPRPYLLIFATQFASWIGWFPLLFYSSLWVADIWRLATAPGFQSDVSSGLASGSTAVRVIALTARAGSLGDGAGPGEDAEAARYGAKALFYRALVGLFVSISAPIIVRATARPINELCEGEETHTNAATAEEGPCTPASSVTSSEAFTDWRQHWVSTWKRWEARLHLLEPVDLWVLSIIFLAAVLISTSWAESMISPEGATVLMAATGFPWAVVGWIPFTLIGTLVGNDRAAEAHEQQLGTEETQTDQDEHLPSTKPSRTSLQAAEHEGVSDAESEWDSGPSPAGSSSRQVYHPLPQPSEEGVLDADLEASRITNNLNDGHLHHKAGTILGLLNIAIVVPQFLSSALSSLRTSSKLARKLHEFELTCAHLVFSIADRGSPQDQQTPLDQAAHDAHAIGLTLRIGAVFMIAAAWTAWRLATRYRTDLRPTE